MNPGSISSGTLRSQDLLSTFAAHLPEERYNDLKNEAEALALCIEEGSDDVDSWHISEVLDELYNALNDEAPDDHYFGAHPGDGAEFGFWPVDEDDF